MTTTELPQLLDYEPYAGALARLEELKTALADTQTSLNSIGTPHLGANDFTDEAVACAVAKIQAELAANETKRLELTVKANALKIAVTHIEAQIPELYRMAVEQVGREAASRHGAIAADITSAYENLTRLHTAEFQIRRALAERINRPDLPGYLQHDLGNRFCLPVAPAVGWMRR